MKRIISVLMVVGMICSMLVGCNSTASTTEAAQSSAEETKAAEAQAEAADVKGKDVPEEDWLPLVKNGETKKLTVGIRQNPSVDDYDTNAFTRYIEEKTGVDIEFVYLANDRDDAFNQLNLMATGGEKFPDVLVGMMSDDMTFTNQLGEAGFLIDMTDLIENEGHYIWKSYEAQDEKVKDEFFNRLKSPETGEIYALPLVMCASDDDQRPCVSINTAWLNKLGLEMPTSVAELKDVLKAFVEKDPNGNGKADEVGIIGVGDINVGNTPDFIINAYVYYEAEEPYNATDGKVWAPFVTDEWRSALKTLNEFYKEGLIAPAAFTITDESAIIPYVTGEDVSLAGVNVGHPVATYDTTNPLYLDYEPLAPLADETGKGGNCVIAASKYYYSNCITKDCEDPVLAMKFLDFFYTDETIISARHGIVDVDWEYGTGKTYAGTDACISVKNSNAFFEGNQNWHRNVAGFLSHMNYFAIVPETDDPATNMTNSNSARNFEIMSTYKVPEEKVANLMFTSDEAQMKADIGDPVEEYVKSNIALFATGTKDPNSDSDWNAYLNDLNSMGLNDYIDVVQKAYDRMK